ncbi:MAG: chromate resistance protein ChrB domain-containing protein [Microgenomates group bacterium]
MKIIVTHLSPDLDAICAAWLIKKFLPGWSKAQIQFVAAGSTLNNQPVDNQPDIIHVDTGLGKFDHHQQNETDCSSKKVFQFLLKNGYLSQKNIPPLERLVEIVNLIDYFHEVSFPNPTSDIYDFCLHQIIEGLKPIINNDLQLTEMGFKLLDAVLIILGNKIFAEKEIKEKAYVFKTKWGKVLAVESKNEETIKLALKMGYQLTIRKDPKKQIVRIKAHPESKIDLTPLYKEIIKIDKTGSWFLHSSKKMLLNGSSKNPKLKPTSLSLLKIIEIVKKSG